MSGPDSIAASVASYKHQQLADAIANVDHVQDHLDDLIARITGEDRPEVAKDPNTRPDATLVEVLQSGSVTLNDRVTAIRERIQTIEGLLF